MSEYVEAWRCIGCGRVEAPAPCIGVCQDRRVDLVYAAEHEAVVEQLGLARDRMKALEMVVRRLAWTTPHDDEWASSYRALQQQARRILTALPQDGEEFERAAGGDALQKA